MKPIEFKDTEEFGSLIRISSVPGFKKWLVGKTCPLVSDDPNPFDWAYKIDYDKYIKYELAQKP